MGRGRGGGVGGGGVGESDGEGVCCGGWIRGCVRQDNLRTRTSQGDISEVATDEIRKDKLSRNMNMDNEGVNILQVYKR